VKKFKIQISFQEINLAFFIDQRFCLDNRHVHCSLQILCSRTYYFKSTIWMRRSIRVNADISGNIASQFSSYTTEANRQLVMASFQNSPFTKHIPVSALEEIAQHPESSTCRHLAGSAAKFNATTTSTQK
jgi:hypothetical protein